VGWRNMYESLVRCKRVRGERFRFTEVSIIFHRVDHLNEILSPLLHIGLLARTQLASMK
jgi:hypothetical protein